MQPRPGTAEQVSHIESAHPPWTRNIRLASGRLIHVSSCDRRVSSCNASKKVKLRSKSVDPRVYCHLWSPGSLFGLDLYSDHERMIMIQRAERYISIIQPYHFRLYIPPLKSRSTLAAWIFRAVSVYGRGGGQRFHSS